MATRNLSLPPARTEANDGQAPALAFVRTMGVDLAAVAVEPARVAVRGASESPATAPPPLLATAVSQGGGTPPSSAPAPGMVSNGFGQANPTDTNFTQQWHLLQPDPGEFDLNVVAVWDDWTGAGINTWVLDDGFDYLHSDLVANYNQAIDIDYEAGAGNFDNDAAAVFTADNHGTSAMGIIGAARNGTGVVGVAYDTRLSGIRGYSDDAASGGSLDQYVTAIGDGARHAALNGGDVISMSNGYGNAFDEGITTAPQTLADWAFVAANGRGGLGLNIVKSAGNNRDQFDDINQKSVDASVYSISVAAIKQDGFVDAYSSFGSALLVSAFGTPADGPQVVTTDRTGAPGYNGTDINPGFNGTSAAAPMVAGVVALMLDANEGLGWRDVQNILAATSRHVGSVVGGARQGSEFYFWKINGSDTWNGGGMHFSNDYGYGLVDALAAARLAETWLFTQSAKTSANLVNSTLDMVNSPQQIPLDNPNGLFITATESENVDIEYTTVTISMSPTHTFSDNLSVLIRSPNGTISNLKSEGTGGATDFPGTWTFTTLEFKGEASAGQWAIYFQDGGFGETGTVTDVVVRSHGSAPTVNDTYVFTNEYGKFVAPDRTQIADGDGGIDTFNASAVTSASEIDLNARTVSIIDGVVLTTDGSIENVIGGDGGDQLVGNAKSNVFWGMRGNDTMSGGAGNDILLGGNGADTLQGGIGRDILDGDLGIDTADFTDKTASVALTLLGAASVTAFVGGVAEDTVREIENVVGGAVNDTLSGDGSINRLDGYLGDDVLKGGGSADTLNGHAGFDIVDFRDKSAAVTLTLNGTTNVVARVGTVNEDTLRNIEGIYGGSAGDTLTGDALANLFRGGGGVDTINGFGGTDTIDFSDKVLGVTLALAGSALVTATVGGVAEDRVRNVENIRGGSGSDTLTGDTLANQLFGQVGNDKLRGGGGADRLEGGAGADVFVYGPSLADSTVLASGRDTILDFATGDKIDLTLIDANTTLAGNQAFSTALAAGAAGRLTLTSLGSGNWLVQGYVDANTTADFALVVDKDIGNLVSADFLL